MKLNGTYLGIVEDINDDLKIGRCRIRVSFLHGDIVPTSELPWAYPEYTPIFGKGGQCGAVSIPKKGSIVKVTFQDGDIYHPEYAYLQELADDVKEFLKKDYDNTHVLLFDGDKNLNVYYVASTGLRIELQESYINIGNDSIITIEHKDTKSLIELSGGTITVNADSQVNTTATTSIVDSSNEVWSKGKVTKLGVTPNYSAVLGEPLFLLLSTMASAIDAKIYPTPGVMAGMVEQTKSMALSKTVMVSQ